VFTDSLQPFLKLPTIEPRNGVITFKFVSGDNQISSKTQDYIRFAIKNTIEPFINVRFEETTGDADINYQLHDDEKDYAFADLNHNVFLSRSNDTTEITNGFQAGLGTHGFQTLIHETLHALGLDHPGNYNGDGSGSPGPFLPYAADNNTNTLMSYNQAGKKAITPMPYDVAALQAIYGASNLNSDDTIYRFDSVYSFNAGNLRWGFSELPSKLTLSDAGGNDTVDLSNLKYDASGYVLNAEAGGILTTRSAYNASSYQPKDASNPNTPAQKTSTFGTGIGFNSQIENIVGSHSNDFIVAGAQTNNLSGLSGDDQLFGGTGNDQLHGEGGDDFMAGEQGDDILFGGNGKDGLSGSSSFVSNERDQLFGGDDQDFFLLGSESGPYYQGDGFAIIKDWQAGLDRIFLGSKGNYSTRSAQLSGSSALDTGIYYNDDLIGIIEDSTDVSNSRGDFAFA
jgi:Ca2+-binding RTX toxin-like protein